MGAVRIRWVGVLGAMAGIFVVFSGFSGGGAEGLSHHSSLERAFFRAADSDLVVMYSAYFATAGRCGGCHGGDSLGIASVDSQGRDVNVTDDWRSTMMANSARDPFFRAKLEHEVLVNPGHQGAIEGKCLSCHAPLGFHEEHLLGNAPFNAAMLDTSTLGLDGVSCLACHMQGPDSAGSFFSGELHFDSAMVYGPYQEEDIVGEIMEFFVGWKPTYGAHITDGRVCAGCHTLITETADLQGTLTGDRFVEQATWHEWKNSIYFGTEQNCRGCHIPRINDSIVLASEYVFLSGQSPFGLHHLVGGNTFMLELMKDHRTTLGIPASATQFDSTIARTRALLQQRTLEMDLAFKGRTSDTVFMDVELVNLTGHKFPSGYPSRRAFVQLILTDDQGDTLFASGLWDAEYELIGHDSPYEPHHDRISSADQVQVYELVMGDVNGDVTTVLERAKEAIKDDRLVPIGFSTSHYTYDTVAIAGVPAADLDFNHDPFGVEGNGGDVVHFHVPLDGYAGSLTATARVYYQPVPPAWNAEMFALNGPRIDTFRTFYEQADGTPELVSEAALFSGPLSLGEEGRPSFRVFPNPTNDGRVFIEVANDRPIRDIQLLDAKGRVIPIQLLRSGDQWMIQLPEGSGTYHLVMQGPLGPLVERIVRL
ncbi:MAG: hypothetical protein KDB88_12460 [Flavobacteriales bacterium]|nr:hypothetical protein [Flavobacteriales bacterium]